MMDIQILIVIWLIIPASAELSDVETLKNVTSCDIIASVDLACLWDEMIAVQSLQYAYDVRCEGICCNVYTSTDCFESATETDIQSLRRTCSGQSTCSLSSFQDKRSFCAYGIKDTSYIFLQYFCIPKTRVSTICSAGTKLMSDNLPLYIINENYPSVTTGHVSCSCSLEIHSCTANIRVYTLDADLYLDESHCDQSLKFVDKSNKTVTELNCESHYKNEIEMNNIARHHTRVDFINNSTANQEGYFFIGFHSTEPLVSFVLNCGAEHATWCSECGVLPNIKDGTLTLNDDTNSSYGATAEVLCDTGYETNTATVACLANGTWSDASCFKTASCDANEQRCEDGMCIPVSDSCSSVPNCTDGSTENCTASCAANEQRCEDGVCKPVSDSCSCLPDCTDGSTENCTLTTTPVPESKGLGPTIIIAIVIGCIAIVFLIQLVVSLVLYKKENRCESSRVNVVLGSIPVVGLVFICNSKWTICKKNQIGSTGEDKVAL